MHKSAIVLGFILILVVILTGIMSKSEDPTSEKRKSTKLSATMSLRPYRYNQELDFSTGSRLYFTLDDFTNNGRDLRSKGSYRKAEDTFKTALLFDPTNASIIREIGELVYIDGRFDEACNYFTQYLRLKPEAIESYTNLAISLIRANDLMTAEMIAKKGLSRVGKDQPGPFYLILACVRQRKGDRKQAEAFFLKAYEALGREISNVLNSQWAAPLQRLDGYREIQKALSREANTPNDNISAEFR